jgi:bifunctional UDP-N-acetylglucosamine pyrophosphorylase/glucosamine-1-phosphate N-acetyltransferase
MSSDIKQALVLAGGKSSRFIPFNQHRSKLATKIMGRSILEWTLASLAQSQIEDIIVVLGSDTEELREIIRHFIQANQTLSIQTVIQQQPQGMADAILTAKNLLRDRFLVINGSQFNAGKLIPQLQKIDSSVVVSCQSTQKPWLYGIVKTQGDQAVKLVEKPLNHSVPAQRVVSGYVLTNEFINYMANQSNNEYLLEESLNEWMKNHPVKVNRVNQAVPSLKYSWHLLDIKDLLFNQLDYSVSEQAKIADSALIKGDVYIGKNALIGQNAIVEGPAYIGAGAVVGRYSVVRKKSVLEAKAEIQSYTDLSDSLVMQGAHIHSGFVGNSIIGQQARIGANFVTANRRLDRDQIKPTVKGKSVKTQRTRLGAMVGHQAKIGINVGTMPGIVIDCSAQVYPGVTIFDNYSA